MKRFFVFGALMLFVFSMIGGVLAVTDGETAGKNVGDFLKGVGDGVGGFFTGLFGESFKFENSSNFFFAILLGMFIYSIISSAFSGFSNSIKWIMTICISALAYIGMPNGFLDSLLPSYGAMGLTILTIIPFVIIFFFSVTVKDLLLARATWGLYFVYYFSIVIVNLFKEGSVNPVHLLSAAIGLLMFWLVPYFRHWVSKGKVESDIETAMHNVAVRKAGLDAEQKRLSATTGITGK